MASLGLKICGITRQSDLQACAELGVDAVGINLWAGSRRGLAVARAAELLAGVDASGLERIGVFVDRSPPEVAQVASDLGLDAVQWHGDAPPDPYAALGVPWVWVVRGCPPLETLEVPKPLPRWVLLDAAVPGYGGAGAKTDWSWAAHAVTWLAPLPVWLAGGINPGNAAQAIATVAPAGLDVASGAELGRASAGEKDHGAIAALRAVTNAGTG